MPATETMTAEVTLTAHDVPFGVEIECYVPSVAWGRTAINGYHSGQTATELRANPECSTLPAGWKAERDGSLGTPPRESVPGGWIAVEIVSPKLQGTDGVEQITTILAWLRGMGAQVNASTGLHVTCTFPAQADAVRRLCHIVARYEEGIYATTGTKTRERGAYCRPLKGHTDARLKGLRTLNNDSLRQVPRYHILNLQHIACGSNRIEFRAFAGTLNTTKLLGHVMLCLGIVVRARTDKQTVCWDPTPVRNNYGHKVTFGKGSGYITLYRLYQFLGWWNPKNSRSSRSEGSLVSPAELKKARDLLFKMAEKYDGRE
jgi:hypothetical protein